MIGTITADAKVSLTVSILHPGPTTAGQLRPKFPRHMRHEKWLTAPLNDLKGVRTIEYHPPGSKPKADLCDVTKQRTF